VNSASRCSVVLALTIALALGAAPHPPDPAEVPFEYSRAFGLMLIKAEVNGKPAVMVLDTGSNETIVSPRLVIVKQLSSKEAVALAKGSGYSGTGVIATAVLSIGPLNPKNCQILVVDLSDLSKTLGQEVDGILGMSVLKEFEIVSVDLRHHKLVLK
jgi:predicted aspartyl protease